MGTEGIQYINIDRIQGHPDNPRIILREDVIEGIAEQIREEGRLDQSGALLVRPHNGRFQIIKGHQRLEAALRAGLDTVPCWVEEMDDDEATWQLIADPQGERTPLEVGLGALLIPDGQDGRGNKSGLSEYARKMGMAKSRGRITDYRNAARVYKNLSHIGRVSDQSRFLDKASHLAAIYQCQEQDWSWLVELMMTGPDPKEPNSLSVADTQEVCKTVRQLDDAVVEDAADCVNRVLDLQAIKQQVAHERAISYRTSRSAYTKIIQKIQACWRELPEGETTLYFYNASDDAIITRQVDLRERYIGMLKDTQDLTVEAINTVLERNLSYKQAHTKEAAELEQKYYLDERYRVEREARRRIEEEHRAYVEEAWLRCDPIDAMASKLNKDTNYVSGIVYEVRATLRHELGDFKPAALRLYDVWSFAKCNENYGTPGYPGQIPGQIVENTLYYYTNVGDIVLDPMVGGGTTIDVCKAMGRRYLGYDMDPIRDDIRQHDIDDGVPELPQPATEDGVKLIFMDPPYWSMKDDDYKEGSASSKSLEDFNEWLTHLAETSLKILADGGYVAVLIQNQTEKDIPEDSAYIEHVIEVFNRFRNAGFKPIRRIACPQSTETFGPEDTAKAKEDKRMMGLVRDLLIMQKE